MMLNFDLFYSNTNYKISETHIFPHGEVYGFTVYPDTEDYKLLQLTKMYTANKAYRPVIFQVSDNDTPVALLEFSTKFDDRGIFTDLNGNYCGCMCVSPIFITWVRTLAGFSFTIPNGSVILNPSYCLAGTNGSVDCRVKLDGVQVDCLTVNNGYFVKHDAHTYSIYNCKATLPKPDNVEDKGLEKLIFISGKYKATLDGRSISLNMLPPDSPDKFNKTYITVAANTVHFQDAGLEV